MKNFYSLLIILFWSNYFFASVISFNKVSLIDSDSIKIITVHYSESKPDSSAYINIDYPQLTEFDNKVVEDKINQFLKNEFEQSILWYNEILADTSNFNEDGYDFSYSFETGFQVKYNTKKFLSITLDHYQYTGGAHGNYYSLGYNIDMSDGKILTLSDIIDNDSFDLLSYECEQTILDTFQVGSLLEAGLFENEITILPDQDFYIIPEALVLQFDPYEIGPFSMGEINIAIPFNRIKDILKPNLPFSIN